MSGIRGTFLNLKEKDGRGVPLEEALENGHLTFWLDGRKLRGGYALTKIGKGKNWLLVKMNDSMANPQRNPVAIEPESVLSGKTVGKKAGKRMLKGSSAAKLSRYHPGSGDETQNRPRWSDNQNKSTKK